MMMRSRMRFERHFVVLIEMEMVSSPSQVEVSFKISFCSKSLDLSRVLQTVGDKLSEDETEVSVSLCQGNKRKGTLDWLHHKTEVSELS